MNVLLVLSHSIEEYDQLRLLHGLGATVASIGGYIDPAHPHDPKRPALPEIPMVPEIKAAVDALGTTDNLMAAQCHLPDAVLDWAEVIIWHHHLDRLYEQWDRIRAWRAADSARRVIWRTVGQSVAGNEADAAPFRADGFEIVRYSPKERNIPGYAGEDALIRFYKDPADYYGWTGEDARVIQFVQNFGDRWEWCNRPWFDAATEGLPVTVYGPQSETLPYGGGTLSFPDMQATLRRSRAYLYTGTQPASYTLGLIEAMMTGIPVVSIGPGRMRIFPYGPELFEGHEIAGAWFHDPTVAHHLLDTLVSDIDEADRLTARARAIELFGRDTIAAQWAAHLGIRVAVAA